jgi:hypothetical protein
MTLPGEIAPPRHTIRKGNPMPASTVHWHGTLTGIQPRLRLERSFDERWETYLDYVLGVEGYQPLKHQSWTCLGNVQTICLYNGSTDSHNV